MTFNALSHVLALNPFIPLLLICHFLADFHLQSHLVADLKEKAFSYLLRHLCHVAWPLAFLGLLQPVVWPAVVVIFLSHALLDGLKPLLKRLLNCSDKLYFSLDQLVHLTVSLGLALNLSQEGAILATQLGSWNRILNMILFFLLITKPANIAFRVYFGKYQPAKLVLKSDQVLQKQDKQATIAGAGATIGSLERVVMGICILFGQFASIGLVFTAKSIARYNKISEDPAFAEYYLIGSLFSILTVLLAAWICIF
ncbi:DUF3307 domain-containing protein [Streptococcus merionis]|uniref:DUF3307 domain-containing protein n=1 Tax=Streptococcus merionis TaxID=400065 RepID=UPI0026F2DCE7|nr:DUF3307 domain-containing protein [Streptococcus merionis]